MHPPCLLPCAPLPVGIRSPIVRQAPSFARVRSGPSAGRSAKWSVSSATTQGAEQLGRGSVHGRITEITQPPVHLGDADGCGDLLQRGGSKTATTAGSNGSIRRSSLRRMPEATRILRLSATPSSRPGATGSTTDVPACARASRQAGCRTGGLDGTKPARERSTIQLIPFPMGEAPHPIQQIWLSSILSQAAHRRSRSTATAPSFQGQQEGATARGSSLAVDA